jgi:RNA polymerase sigma-70 factor (ECF subfamily)
MPPADGNPEDLLRLAKSGREASLGALLELYRRYLGVLARVEIGRRLQGKVDPSDLVQETFLEAHRAFPRFEGSTERQFLAWVRQILAGRVAHLVRHYVGTQGRDVRLEQDLAAQLDQSSHLLDGGLISDGSSPAQLASGREQSVLLADAIARLPEDYRDVIVLRHLEGLTFPEVATRMEKTQDSVEKLWVRGLTRLRKLFGKKD